MMVRAVTPTPMASATALSASSTRAGTFAVEALGSSCAALFTSSSSSTEVPSTSASLGSEATSGNERNKTLPDVQSMLLLANLFGTTIDEMVRGDVDEMREMVEKDEQQRKAFAIALGAVEVTVIGVLAFMAVAGRDYLDSALRLLLAVLVLASAVVALVARRGGEGREAKSAAELLGAASGDPVEAAQESASANVM